MIRLTGEDLKKIQFDPAGADAAKEMAALLDEMEVAFDEDVKSWMAKFLEFVAIAATIHGKLDPASLLYVLLSTGMFVGARMQERKTNPHMTVHLQIHPENTNIH